jgi:hypothetical protein
VEGPAVQPLPQGELRSFHPAWSPESQ